MLSRWYRCGSVWDRIEEEEETFAGGHTHPLSKLSDNQSRWGKSYGVILQLSATRKATGSGWLKAHKLALKSSITPSNGVGEKVVKLIGRQGSLNRWTGVTLWQLSGAFQHWRDDTTCLPAYHKSNLTTT